MRKTLFILVVLILVAGIAGGLSLWRQDQQRQQEIYTKNLTNIEHSYDAQLGALTQGAQAQVDALTTQLNMVEATSAKIEQLQAEKISLLVAQNQKLKQENTYLVNLYKNSQQEQKG